MTELNVNKVPLFFSALQASFDEYSSKYSFCIEDQFYTYNDLQTAVYCVQQVLENKIKSCKSRRIAVVCKNDIRTYAALLALWFSGYTYVPLGLHNPVERNLSILNEAEVEIIISIDELDDDRYSQFEVLCIPSETSMQGKLKLAICGEEDHAYILFTSGSTGIPKGVTISFGNLINFLDSFENTGFKINSSDRCLQMFELTFDVSISSFLVPLLKGACVYTVPNTGIKYLNVLKIVQEYKLTSIQIVPSIIRLGKPLLPRLELDNVRNCILTGEATSIDLLMSWAEAVPNAKLYNFYGPTEATIYCSYLQIDCSRVKEYNGMLAIGRPFFNAELIVVDDENRVVQVGKKGELLIGGGQVSSGYLNLPEKNRSAFINVEIDGKKKVFYRSGDLCFQDEEGDLFYCGRLDNQIKVQGFRIELSEIEVNVRREFSMNCVVIPVESKNHTIEVVLVLEGSGIEKRRIELFLKSRLPEYMMPARIEQMEEFPVNSSGKTDKVKIKEWLNGML